MELNKYIDFDTMFKDIVSQQEEVGMDSIELQVLAKVKNLVESDFFKTMRIDAEECLITKTRIYFTYSVVYDTATESDNSNSFVRYDISYDRQIEVFSSISQEQE